jgi:hypothetical protein
MKVKDARTWREFMHCINDGDMRQRLALYPMLTAALVADAGGRLDVSDRALVECLANMNQGQGTAAVIAMTPTPNGMALTLVAAPPGTLPVGGPP